MATLDATRATTDSEACQRFFETLAAFGRVHAIKLYRLAFDPVPPVPILPCLDHEAMLHEEIAPHAAAYIAEHGSGGLHEIVLVPATGRIEIDVVSTTEEHDAESQDRVLSRLKRGFPQYTVKVKGPSRLRGERRVARACRAQIPLRDVLMSSDFERLTTAVDRLKTIGGLMEKESRVASWSIRTVTGPLLALAGFFAYQVLGALTPRIGSALVPWLQYAVVGLVGGVFLYFGLKAVQLTEMANRVWKRASEYGLILKERQRLERPPGHREPGLVGTKDDG